MHDTEHRDPPDGGHKSLLHHRVQFHETDAMGVMHHAEHVKLLEEARVVWLEEHGLPYRGWVEQDLHLAVVGLDVRYRRSVGFDDEVVVEVWLEKVGGASCRIAYEMRCADGIVARAWTEHGMVDGRGRPTRIPRDRRQRLQGLVSS